MMVVVLVRHVKINNETAQFTSEYIESTNCYCALGCKAASDKDLEKYLGHTEERD